MDFETYFDKSHYLRAKSEGTVTYPPLFSGKVDKRPRLIDV